MKKLTTILLSTLLVLTFVFTLASCGNDDLALKVDENHAQAQAAIQEAVDKAEADLTASEEELKVLISGGDSANVYALEQAITDFDAALSNAIETLDASIEQTNVNASALQAALESAKSELSASIDTLSADLKTKSEALNALILANDADIDSLIQAKNELQAELEATNSAVDALSSSTLTKFDEISTAITALETSFNNGLASLDTVYIRLDNWDSATDDVIAATFEISVFYNNLYKEMYYPSEWDALVTLHESTKIALLRAASEASVDSILNDTIGGYYMLVNAIPTRSDIVYQTLTAYGTTVEEVLLNDEWGPAIQNAEQLIAAEQDPKVLEALADVIPLTEAFRERYDYLAAQKPIADQINTDTANLIAQIQSNGYTADNKAEYERIIAAVEVWDANVGAANAAMINREALASLSTEYDFARESYENAAVALNDRLTVFNAPDYVYTYNTDLDTIVALYNDGILWSEDVVNRGFALDGEVETPVNKQLTAFIADTYDRAIKLEAANSEAISIEAQISSLYSEIEFSNTIYLSYKNSFELIAANVLTWKNTYFGTPYESEAVIGNANYELLDHVAFDQLSVLYGAKVAPVMGLFSQMEKLETITVDSYPDIVAAKTTYLAVVENINGSGYTVEGLPSPEEMQSYFDAKEAEYQALINNPTP